MREAIRGNQRPSATPGYLMREALEPQFGAFMMVFIAPVP
jgi:hypothetical protein